MKKNKNLIFIIALLVFSNLITFSLSNIKYAKGKDNKLEKITFLENYVKKNYLYPVKDEQLAEGEFKGVVKGLNDPYSEYLTKKEYKQLMEYTTGKFYGIGVMLGIDNDDTITVIAPIKDSPAEKSGIKKDDKIIKINGKAYDKINFVKAAQAIRGPKNSEIDIVIFRKSENKTLNFKIKRNEIKTETIISKKLNNIGYIGITQFEESTAKDFKKALNDLNSKGISSLVIDLRGNPGGIVDSAAEIANEILPKGTIVSAKDREGKKVFEYKSDSKYFEKPLVVLINKGSASASEILSGAIRDYKRGLLIGEKTFGKGVVQSVVKFSDGDGIKLTTSEYFTPKGISINKKGIEPDIKIDEPKDVKGIGINFLKTDVQLKKALEELKNK